MTDTNGTYNYEQPFFAFLRIKLLVFETVIR